MFIETQYRYKEKADILKKKAYSGKQFIASHLFHFLVKKERKKENSMGFLFENMFHQKETGLRKIRVRNLTKF